MAKLKKSTAKKMLEKFLNGKIKRIPNAKKKSEKFLNGKMKKNFKFVF